MAANARSVLPIEWTRFLKDNPEMTMKDFDAFVKLNKAPQSYFCRVCFYGPACKTGRGVSRQVLTYWYDFSLSW